MNILGLSKKAKKRFSSYKNDRGMRRCKSTGNIYSNAQVANSDSSISSNESDNEDKMKITQKIKDLKVADNSKESSVENNKKKVLLSDPKPQSILNTATSTTTATTTTTTTTPTKPTKPNNYTSSKNPGITISTEEEKVTPKVSSCPTSPIINNNNNNMKLLSATTTTNIQQDDLDALLSLEAQERMDAQLNRDQNEINNKPLRPTTLKFALPEPPVRTISRSKSPIVYPRARPYRSRSAESVDRSSQLQQRRHVSPSRKKANKRHSRWSRLMGSDSDESDSDSDDANIIKLQIGTKVNLFKRPLPTVGYIRYIGPVDNEIGQWIGVELDHRVGNCDGSIKGKSYFKTGPQRGIFLKEADIEPIN